MSVLDDSYQASAFLDGMLLGEILRRVHDDAYQRGWVHSAEFENENAMEREYWLEQSRRWSKLAIEGEGYGCSRDKRIMRALGEVALKMYGDEPKEKSG